MLPKLSRQRLTVLAVFLGLGFVTLEYRLYHLHVTRHDELLRKADRHLRVRRVLEPWRGEIRTSDEETLAMDVPVKEVWADLTVCGKHAEQTAEVVAPLLQTDAKRLALRLEPALIGYGSYDEPIYRQAVLVKRHLRPREWDQMQQALTNATFGLNPNSRESRSLLKRLRYRALFVRDRRQRFYPFGTLLCQTLGFMGATEESAAPQGQLGLEQFMDSTLSGDQGYFRSEKTAGGIELPWRRRHDHEPTDGDHLVLTIHAALQRVVEAELSRIMAQHSPAAASILVMRTDTGRILAMGSSPGFDPHHPGDFHDAAWRNRVIHDQVEPGSTFKIVTLAAALNEGVVALEDQIYCEEGEFNYQTRGPGGSQGRTITLKDYKSFGWLTAEEGFYKSSNICMAKLALRLGPERFSSYIRRFGFGKPTGIPLPREQPGHIPSQTNWLGDAILYLPMGQGISVTQLQMTLAYCAIANDGLLMRPMLVERIVSPDGVVQEAWQPQAIRQVVSGRTARLVRQAMRKAVSRQGTGSAATSPLVTVCGKTGTAQKSDANGYLPGRFYASFIGLLPTDAPQFCISVAVDEPSGDHQGGVVAAPAFRRISEAAAALFAIPPTPLQAPWRGAVSAPPRRRDAASPR